jgi:hypothetical protein
MPSEQLPSAANNYECPSDGFKLSRVVWNAVFGSIAERLTETEAVRADFEDLIEAGTTQAIAVIQTNVEPQLTAIAEVIANLEANIALAEDRIATIVGAGISAAQVAESGTRVFVTPAQKTMIGTLAASLGGDASFATTMSTALASKASISDVDFLFCLART